MSLEDVPPEWAPGIVTDSRNNTTGLSMRRWPNKMILETMWSRSASGAEIAAKLRELAEQIEAADG